MSEKNKPKVADETPEEHLQFLQKHYRGGVPAAAEDAYLGHLVKAQNGQPSTSTQRQGQRN